MYRTNSKLSACNRPKKILKVTFPEYDITICEKFAADTLKNVIMLIGPSRVAEICRREINSTLHSNYVPLVTKIKNEEYSNRQHEIGNGWLVFTGTSSEVKKKQLDMLKDMFHINMRVSLV